MNSFYTPNDPACMGGSDSESIQRAVDAAAQSGAAKVVIPALNARTGAYRWDVDRAILLPDHIHVVLDNAYGYFAGVNGLEKLIQTFFDTPRRPRR